MGILPTQALPGAPSAETSWPSAADGAVHLAGMAFVPAAWDDPVGVYDINTLGAIRLTETFRAEAPEAKVVIVTSSEVYGRESREGKIREDAPLTPSSPYGSSVPSLRMARWARTNASICFGVGA